MIPFMVVNKDTGEIDNECGICSVGILPAHSDIDIHEQLVLDELHMIIELTPDEYDEITGSIRYEYTGKDGVTPLPDDASELTDDERRSIKVAYTKKVDKGKAMRKLDEREKIDVPIEIEMPGGKDIIGLEEKPENIIIGRNR